MWLAYLEDSIFESMENGEAQKWPERFLTAIPVGVDLEQIKPKFLLWLLTNKEHGCIRYVDNEKFPEVVKAIMQTAAYLGNWIAVGEPDEAARSAARSAAWSAAESVAWSAAESVAWSAAESVAWSAARSAAWSAARSAAWSAAESVAWSAAESVAWSAARSAAWSAAAQHLLELLKEAE